MIQEVRIAVCDVVLDTYFVLAEHVGLKLHILRHFVAHTPILIKGDLATLCATTETEQIFPLSFFPSNMQSM